MRNEWAICIELQIKGEVCARRIKIECRQCIGICSSAASHAPRINPGVERRGGDARLTNAAARKAFGNMVPIGSRDCCMPHPHLRACPTCCVAGCEGRSKECPLDAVSGSVSRLQICGDVPPLDTEVVVCAVISGKAETLAGYWHGEPFGTCAEPSKALGVHRRRQRQAETNQQCPNAHWQRPLAIRTVRALKAARPAVRPQAPSQGWIGQLGEAIRLENSTSANAIQTLRH